MAHVSSVRVSEKRMASEARGVNPVATQQCAFAIAYFEKEPRQVDDRVLDGEILRLEFDGEVIVVPPAP